MNVADLAEGKPDRNGHPVQVIYSRNAPEYAVYKANHRVTIHYADDPARAAAQRQDMAQLAPLRGEIEGLIDGWRDNDGGLFGASRTKRLGKKAAAYQRRVADALVVALEKDLTGARDVMAAVKSDILNERIAWARFEHLITAAGTALALMFFAWLMSSLLADYKYPDTRPGPDAAARLTAAKVDAARWTADLRALGLIGLAVAALVAVAIAARESLKHPMMQGGLIFLLLALPVSAVLLWPGTPLFFAPEQWADGLRLLRAAAAGALGAFFSITLAIRGRTILPDLLRTANLMDAVLRVFIGCIGGVVLEGLILLEVVNLRFGAVALDGGRTDSDQLLAVLLTGFIAGFSERLVPDMLSKFVVDPAQKSPLGAAAPRGPAGGERRPPPNGGAGPVDQGQDGNAPKPGGPAAGAAAPSQPKADATAEEPIGEDGCASGHIDSELDATPDSDLPPAIGGVSAH